MTLGLVAPGEQCEIVAVRHCGGCGEQCQETDHADGNERATRAEELGLRVGKRIEMLKNDGNLLLLLVDEARIAIDRRMAMKIMVRR